MDEGDDADENDTSSDRDLFYANIGLVIVVNFATICNSKRLQTNKKTEIAETVKCKATFKEGELCQSPPAVDIRGYFKVRALRVSNRRLKTVYEDVNRRNT